MPTSRQQLVFAAAGVILIVAGWVSDQQSNPVVMAAGIVLAILVLWVSEVAPLGITAMIIPVVATLSGILKWQDALAAWGDPIIFLFMGTFLLARALDKHGVLDAWARGRWSQMLNDSSGLMLPLVVMLVAGAVSSVQNNTAVTAMFLPVVLRLSQKQAQPALALLALAYGATFGGMATAVGTAPNFLGYRHMKEIDPHMNFVVWLKVGIPVWIGTSLMAWFVLGMMQLLFKRHRQQADAPVEFKHGLFDSPEIIDVGPARDAHRASPDERSQAALWAQAAFAATVVVWLASGLIAGFNDANSPVVKWLASYLPEALPPLVMAWLLFQIKVGPARKSVLDRHDFQALDWDTLFLIAGGLCLGKVLDVSGADDALARSVGGLSQFPPLALMLALAGVTVLLSELTSNTATAALMVSLAESLAGPLGLTPVQAIWLVALSASLGFALPVSTPPNALIYGTRKVPLGLMMVSGVTVDLLCVVWVVLCIRWFA